MLWFNQTLKPFPPHWGSVGRSEQGDLTPGFRLWINPAAKSVRTKREMNAKLPLIFFWLWVWISLISSPTYIWFTRSITVVTSPAAGDPSPWRLRFQSWLRKIKSDFHKDSWNVHGHEEKVSKTEHWRRRTHTSMATIGHQAINPRSSQNSDKNSPNLHRFIYLSLSTKSDRHTSSTVEVWKNGIHALKRINNNVGLTGSA